MIEGDIGAQSTGTAQAEAVADVLERLSEELAFLVPGTAEGLLPVNALIMDLEELPGLSGVPLEAVKIARRWLDEVLDGAGHFSAAEVQNLHAWTQWFIDHLVAVETGRPAVPFPVQWRSPAEKREPSRENQNLSGPAASPAGSGAALTLRIPEDLDLLREFHSESLDLLSGIEQSVLALENGSATAETVHSVFRAFHTFKGSAGFLQLDALRDFAHRLESLLDEVRSERLPAGPPVIAAILAGADVLAACMAAIGAQVTGAIAPTPIPLAVVPTLELIDRALSGEAEPAPGNQFAAVQSEPPLAPVSLPATAAPSELQAETFVRVDAAKLDALVNLVGELVITQSFVLGHRDNVGSQQLEWAYAVRKLTRITRELQHATLSMRMVPISSLFRRMSRLVRDLSSDLGKQARLVLHGEDTELDRHLVERMADPLVHMIRNAMDHGIETPEARRAAGKDPIATIRLAAAHAHGGVRIDVIDDGRGIDADAVRTKAVAQGLIAADDPGNREEILRLIFRPGFTTAASVTAVSGRGVGMDVVKGHIDALRGHVDIATLAGQGTTFSIRLPLTLSQIDGFVVRVAGERYILASAAVRECLRIADSVIAPVHDRGEIVTVRGESMPLLRLKAVLDNSESDVLTSGTGIIVILETSVGIRAVLVDDVLGKQEVIIKNLGDAFANQTLIGGGAIMADGRVALILDAETLARMPTHPLGRLSREVA